MKIDGKNTQSTMEFNIQIIIMRGNIILSLKPTKKHKCKYVKRLYKSQKTGKQNKNYFVSYYDHKSEKVEGCNCTQDPHGRLGCYDIVFNISV